jgi:beta-lactamase regulating signal transducer with metallopeptidase domain
VDTEQWTLVFTEPQAPEPAPVAAQPGWLDLAGPLWLGGSLLCLGWMLLHVYRFGRLLRHARPAPLELQDRVRRLAEQLGMRRCPLLWLVPGAVSPMVWAVGLAPRLLFPVRLLERLDEEQQATLLVHELAHVRRRDHWVRLLELVVMALYWWHPVVWWARRELHEAEEQCCDAWVVWARAGAARAYALALLQTVAFFSKTRVPLPMAASGTGQVTHLRRRLTMIMQAKTPRSLSRAGGVAVVGLGLLLLPLLPGHAQDAPAQPAAESDTDSRDQQIEALKRAVRILEEQKHADQGKAAGDKKAVDEKTKVAIQKAKARVQKTQAAVEARRAEFEKAMQAHQAALADVAKLEGRANWGAPLNYYRYRPVEVNGRATYLLEQDANEPLHVRAVEPDGHRVITIERRGINFTPAIPKPIPQEGANKAGDLERKLDRLFREVEELRRELHQQKAPPNTADDPVLRNPQKLPPRTTAPEPTPLRLPR